MYEEDPITQQHSDQYVLFASISALATVPPLSSVSPIVLSPSSVVINAVTKM